MAALASFVVGLAKTGISGLGMVAVVLFASALPARESVGVALAVLLAGDVVAIALYRHEAHWGHLLRLFPWAAGGVVLGALTAGRLDDGVMRTLIGVIVVALAIAQAVRSRRPANEAPAPPWASPAAGLLAGFTTMIANAGGPLMALYLLAMRLPKFAFVGTAAWFFFGLNLFKLPFSFGLGMLDGAGLGISLRLAPLAVLGALAGRPLISRIDQRTFEQIALWLSLLAGLRLLLP